MRSWFMWMVTRYPDTVYVYTVYIYKYIHTWVKQQFKDIWHRCFMLSYMTLKCRVGFFGGAMGKADGSVSERG